MTVAMYPSVLSGTIPAIASKSQAHRLLICAALADRQTAIACPTLSADITATANCLRAMGADITYQDGIFTVKPIISPPDHADLDCGESGSTLRFLLPVVCALSMRANIAMGGRLPERPLSPLWEELTAHGAVLSRPRPDVIAVSGSLRPGDYSIAANISSQFISGLLFALPLMDGPSTVTMTGNAESGSYLDMTVRALAKFGVVCPLQNHVFTVSGGRTYASPGTAQVEGDWSNAAFWIAADRILGGTLNITGLDPDSPQGDRAVEKLSLRIAAGSAVVDCRDVPDLVPVLSVLAAVSPGQTRFIHAGRLRIKESDRLATTAGLIRALGGRAEELEDGLVVIGQNRLTGGQVDSANDHRIAMSAAVAALASSGPVVLRGAQAVNKSYPAFWDDYIRLGGKMEVIEP